MERLTIVIPVYKEMPDHNEKLSFKQCLRVLSAYSVSIVTHTSLNINYYENELKAAQVKYSVHYFEERYFKNIAGYNSLMMKPGFYNVFRKYTYVLIYQLDAFVFVDDFENWCSKGYSYVGAPWIQRSLQKLTFTGVGNGGFSLRHVQDHIRALHSFSYIEKPFTIFRQYFYSKHSPRVYLHLTLQWLKKLTVTNNTYHIFNTYDGNEDFFWCKVVAANFNWFTLPEPEEALKFSMEHEPEYLFNLNNRHLPLGCHAWFKHDIAFWKPIIEHEVSAHQ